MNIPAVQPTAVVKFNFNKNNGRNIKKSNPKSNSNVLWTITL